jgi:hypothetical protein
MQALVDEVVVQAQPEPVVGGVVGDDVGEGNVADHQVQPPLREMGLGERLRSDVRGRIQQRRHPGCGRIQLDPDHVADMVGREPDEGARSAAGLQHPSAGGLIESSGTQRGPHRLDQCGIGVVRVERRTGRGRACPALQ